MLFDMNGLTARFLSREDGNVLVEFGFVATLLMGTVLGALEYAAIMDQSSKISTAARTAVEKAIEDPADLTSITEVAVESGDLDGNTLSVSVNTFCECPDGTPIPCGDTCAGGITNNAYVTVNLSQPAHSMITGSALLNGMSIARSATLRMR